MPAVVLTERRAFRVYPSSHVVWLAVSVNINDRVDIIIARTSPENLWDASSSACREAGYLDFQKSRCPGHSTSRSPSSSIYFLQTCSNISSTVAPCYRGISRNKRDEKRHFWKSFLGYHRFNCNFLHWQHCRVIL